MRQGRTPCPAPTAAAEQNIFHAEICPSSTGSPCIQNSPGITWIAMAEDEVGQGPHTPKEAGASVGALGGCP